MLLYAILHDIGPNIHIQLAICEPILFFTPFLETVDYEGHTMFRVNIIFLNNQYVYYICLYL